MKMSKRFLTTLFACAVAIACLFTGATTAKAATDGNQYDENGLFFGSPISTYDSYSLTGGELTFTNKRTEYVDKLRLTKLSDEKNYYPTGSLYLHTSENAEGAELISVKSSSKNLKAIISYKRTDTYNTVYTGSRTSYSEQTVSVLAKKAGTYKVTATIKLANGNIVEKTATVGVFKKYPIDFSLPGTTLPNGSYSAKSVKVKVKKGPKVTNAKYYYSTTPTNANVKENADGSYNLYTAYKEFKSGKKIKLNTKTNSSFTRTSGSITYNYYRDYRFYPETEVIALYKDTFYGYNAMDEITISKYVK